MYMYMEQPKTLIGKNNYLFLINDSSQELNIHCNNLNLVNNETFQRYKFKNFLLIVFPDKSLLYKKYLPDKFKIQFRPGLDAYMKVLTDKLLDTYDILKNEEDVYYKTDTHINIKGSYIVYKQFIQKLNEMYQLDIAPKECVILNKQCILSSLQLGIGDLLWECNLGNQCVEDCIDSFYYSDNIDYIYCKHKIQKDGSIRLLTKDTLIDENDILHNTILSWDILSKYILYKKNITCNNKLKVLIFYDSFLTSTLSLYLELFNEVYMIKDIYNNYIINIINPNFVFEFRVERFLS